MKVALLLTCLLSLSHGQSFSFQGNVTLTNGNDFRFRSTTITDVSIPAIFNGLFFSSLNGDFGVNIAQADGLYGSAYAGFEFEPVTYLSYWTTTSQWQQTNGGATNYAAVNTTAAAAFIGKIFVSLDEVDANNVTVQTIDLKNLIWTLGAVTSANGLSFATFTGTKLLNPNFKVLISLLISNVVGVINVPGSPVVTPKTIESVIEIDSFPYQSTANSVRLNLVVGTAAGNVNVQGSVTRYVSGSGTNTAYVVFSNNHQADGVLTPVSITGWTNGAGTIGIGNANFDLQVRARYGAAATFKFVSVLFKAGATKIVYDPSVGVGSNPPSSSGVSLVPCLAAFLLFFKIFMF